MKITYITLDTFRDRADNINSSLDAWLTFLIKDDMKSVIKLVDRYPEFADIYRDIAEFRKDPKELIGMFSEILAVMDRNMERYMVDELKAQVDELKAQNDTYKSQNDDLKQTVDTLRAEIETLQSRTAELTIKVNEESKRADDAESKLASYLSGSDS